MPGEIPTSSPNPSHFQKGQYGNPAGRPPGSRNKATLAAEALLEGELERLTREAIDRAMDGDALLLRLCITRLLPAPRGRRVQLDLAGGGSVADVAASLEATIRAVAECVISPLEASDVAEVIELQRRTVETVDLERRLAHLEEISGEIETREAKLRRRQWDDDDERPGFTEAELDAPLDTPYDDGRALGRSGA
jgi:Family of unknown function (DUF5681)